MTAAWNILDYITSLENETSDVIDRGGVPFRIDSSEDDLRYD